MKKSILLMLLAASVTIPKNAGAWGKKGHQMVAEIGFSMLDDNTQKVVKKYLGNISVPNAGSWMDDMRSDPRYTHMKPWHFINREKGEVYIPTDNHNIVNEINNAVAALKHKEDLSNEEIQLNILILCHLIGDIGQPLHVGYGSDLGGNDITVKYRAKKSNLHKVWDSEIIESEHITAADCDEWFNKLSDDQADALRVIDPVGWMNHSRRLLNRVYNYKDGSIDEEYITRNKTVIEKQILYSGVRLAATLEELFRPPVKPTLTTKAVKPRKRGSDTVVLEHKWYRSHFVNSAHIPWVVEYTLRADDVNCANPIKRSNKFAPDPLDIEATDIDKDYVGSKYDRGHNMPAADNGCHGAQAMTECFYFSNMVPQTHRLNAGVWKTLEMQERDMAEQDDSIYVWIGSYGVDKKIGANKVVVPKYCWKVIYDYKTREWSAYIFPNNTVVSGRPEDFMTTVADIKAKSGFDFK